MDSKDKKILIRAETIITKYRNEKSIYYDELKKSYHEYRENELPDKTTNKLYINHISNLCDLIEQKKNSNVIIIGMIIMIIFMVTITSISCFKYYDISNNLTKQIIKANRKTNLSVNYYNLDKFNAESISSAEDYMDLIPLEIEIEAQTDDEEDYMVKYDVYLEEQNDDLTSDSVLSKDYLIYNIKSNTRDNGIKYLKDATVENNQLLLFSSEIKTNTKETVELRMWINSSTKNYLNKRYKFKLNVKGYPKE